MFYFFRCASISCTDHRDSLTHWLTDSSKLDMSHSSYSYLTALSPSILYNIQLRPDQTRPDQTLSQITKCFSQIVKCICLILTNEFVLYWQNVFVPSGKMYLFQVAKCICSKLQNVFVSSCKLCLNCKFLVFSSVHCTIHSILYIFGIYPYW